MKTIQYLLVLLTAFPFQGLWAQNVEVSELRASIGVFSFNDAVVTENPSEVSESPWTSEHATPIISGGLSLFVDPESQLEVGFDFSYQQINFSESFRDNTPIGPVIISPQERVQRQTISIMPRVQFNWLRSDDNKFKLYSNMNFGIAIISDKHQTLTQLDDTYLWPSGHLSILGLQFGDQLGGFIEMGAGNRGLLSTGVHYRL